MACLGRPPRPYIEIMSKYIPVQYTTYRLRALYSEFISEYGFLKNSVVVFLLWLESREIQQEKEEDALFSKGEKQ